MRTTPLFASLVAAGVIDLRHHLPSTMMSVHAFAGALVTRPLAR